MPSALILLCFLIASVGLQAADSPSETLAWPDGTRYVGGVKNQMRDGQGTIYWQNGARYIGGFKTNLRHGPGMMIMPDGTTHQGDFFEGQLVGVGNQPDATETPDQGGVLQVSSADRVELRDALDLWAAAWTAQNPDQVFNFYSENFAPPPGQSRKTWEYGQRERILSPSYIEIKLSYEDFLPVSSNVIDVRIRQSYRSNTYRAISNKVIRLQKETAGWRIIGELEG